MDFIQAAFLWTSYVIAGILFAHAVLFAVCALLSLVFNPSAYVAILDDLKAIRERDPAAEGYLAAMFYPGWWALSMHRLMAHPLYRLGLRTPARLVNFFTRFLTGADIHPGARFGRCIFMDHAHGVVIGETAIVGDNVTILHQVTLGGTGKETGKRHPTVEDGVLLSAGAKILGNIVIGRNSKVGSGSVVVHPVPPDSTVVGVPGRVVATGGVRVAAKVLDQTTLPDPLVEKIREVEEELRKLRRDSQRLRGLGLINGTPPPLEPQGKGASPARDLLEEIVEHKRREIEGRRELLSLDKLRERPGARGEPRPFRKALSGPGMSLIAEIKKASPSAGVLRSDFDPATLAKTYQEAGAAALSVLTDERWFQGRLEYLAVARNACALPILRKDFIVSPYQILEASRGGADAVLLIVAALEDGQLRDLHEAAESEGLDALVEVHDEKELERALRVGAVMIGINNRNLRSLAVDLDVTERLLRRLTPEDRARTIIVAESGVKTNADWKRLAELEVNAVLVGTTFMKADDVGGKVRELTGR